MIPFQDLLAYRVPVDVVGPRFTTVHEGSAHQLFMKILLIRSILNEQVRHMFDEIDYILKGKHIKRFASLYGSYPRSTASHREAMNPCILVALGGNLVDCGGNSCTKHEAIIFSNQTS
ncbi:hypothetical protein JRO89_XS11G0176600 [Xanthoceras sorbifolium]|uniref:Uncharacterized protein n=1 Tax=Xanthoceras sorbifolium TaxID=99658 RepID=A0ABQ8HFZ8_9ROSI|nr:hypothetical protein JRO89_XS11G0176600 [Xanthoceras sorbifolium]